MKIPKQAFTTEFRELAIEKVKSGQSIAGTARELGMVNRPSEIGLRQPLAYFSERDRSFRGIVTDAGGLHGER